MKKWGIVALVLMMGLSMVACGSDGKTPETSATTSEEALSEPSADTTEDATATDDQKTTAETEKSSETPTTQTVSMGMITDVGGVNDQSFNQGAWEGMQKAEKEMGADVNYLESKTEADYGPYLENMIDQNKDVIIGVGFKLANDLQIAAETYPDQQFAIIDSEFTPDQVPNNNITGLMFQANDASYLVGYIAGKVSTTGKVGFVSGADSPVMNQFGYGYYAGVLAANPDATIYGQYADAFDNPAKGKAIANKMYSDGADVIFSCAGDTGNGVIEAAKEQKKWVIGVDRDQYDLAPENVLTSAIKRIDQAVMDVAKRVQDGTLVGGETIYYGLKEGGVDIAPSSDKNVPAEVLAEVEEVREKIVSGEIVVPNSAEEFAQEFPNVSFMK